MKNLNVSFSLTSVILSCNLLILSPVLAQAVNSNPIESESLSNLNVIPTRLVSQLSSRNELPLVTSDLESEVQENIVQQIERLDSNQPPELEEITNVDQLEDVTPDHWAYQALRSLVEKYRCISGSGDGNFNGNRAMTRYEFAAAFNNCLLKIRRSIDSLNNLLPQQEELETLERLQAEFATEIQKITNRIGNVEQRVTYLQERQFSTTTVLRGVGIFNLNSAFGDQKAVGPGSHSRREELDVNATLSGATILTLDTSFTGKDRLRTQMLAGNITGSGRSLTGTDMTRFTGAVNTGNDIFLGTVFYEFPIGNRGRVAIAPIADFPTRIFPALNPVRSISNFGAESPIYGFAFGSGTIVYYNFTDQIAAGISYLSSSGSNTKEGLFGGQYTVLTQLTYNPSDKVGIAFTYGHYYAPEPGSGINVTGGKGSIFAQLPFGASTATSSNAFGLQFTYKLTDKFILGGWASYFNAKAEANVSGLNGSQGSNADIWSWAITASLADLGKLGSQLSFVFGMPPKVTSNDIVAREDRDTSLHIELSYRYPITEKIFITPGFFVITNPEHNAANPPICIGLIQTTFIF
ncbi:iron uptake porin [Microseira wollei]|uniref:Carbohydrate-selective porin OprB n=1 Tax=Microseira wollei NIES-4236 TaxID=2530354 RepID=A0AAV3X4X4_9CYAN|nr:iron uptake porin [Microseira wollei]GET37143.1 carbohydrate-selective porin OprB [Microseira wollei NIES-4236]